MVTTKPKDIPQEVPMFLRKTYHMIDSCDPLVAGWSDDGETFVVKDPTKFETEIIPQFFKHSKFTSFVRQLNFYSFRKIKYVDTLRLDPKLEAETANYWRFKHEHFQRGKPHLLMNIKRMTAAQSRAAEKKNAVATNAVATKQPDAVKSTLVNTTNDTPNGGGVAGGEAVMKEEIDTLKKQLEEMNKNMNQLTTMVQQVSLTSSSSKETVSVGNKRKKVEFAEPAPDAVAAAATTSTRISSSSGGGVDAALDYLLDAAEDDSDLMLSDMEMDAIISTAVAPAMPIPAPLRSAALSRASSIASNGTDADFVDQLFTAFGSEHGGGDDQGDIDVEIDVDGHDTDFMVRDALPEPVSSCLPPLAQWREPCYNKNHHNHRSHGRRHYNRPDPELMDRLSEALAVLPKEMQEQIVDRLIASITSNNLFESTNKAATTTSPQSSSSSLGKVPMTEDDYSEEASQVQTPDNEDHTIVGMPLAAATLASLLSYYSQLVKEHRDNNGHHDDDDDDNVAHDNSSNNNNNNKIPVIPCHA